MGLIIIFRIPGLIIIVIIFGQIQIRQVVFRPEVSAPYFMIQEIKEVFCTEAGLIPVITMIYGFILSILIYGLPRNLQHLYLQDMDLV